MTVFKCQDPSCSFVSGNKILFNRHSHKIKVEKDTEKLVCNQCNDTFATPSSLKRHMKRKHQVIKQLFVNDD